MNLAGGFDKVLEVRAGKEVSQIDEFAVILILHINHTPAVLAAANLLAVDNNCLLASDNGEWNDVLREKKIRP